MAISCSFISRLVQWPFFYILLATLDVLAMEPRYIVKLAVYLAVVYPGAVHIIEIVISSCCQLFDD